MKEAQVYILHFAKPYWKQAKHYVGYTTVGVENRIEKHRKGTGSLLVDYAYNKKQIPFTIASIFDCATKEIARALEVKLKNEGHLSRHCPICSKEANNGISNNG